MRIVIGLCCWACIVGGAGRASAQEGVAGPAGRLETGISFLSGLGNEPVGHKGALLEVSYGLLDSLAVGLAVGFLHGAYDDIIVGTGGVIENKMAGPSGCLQDPANCGTIDANVPDLALVTGTIDANLIWSPVYLDALEPLGGGLELYGVVGLGVNGRRSLTATPSPSAQQPADFTVSGGDFGEGGFLGDAEPHLCLGVGARAVIGQVFALQATLRTMTARRTFDFGDGEEGYFSTLWLAQIGASLMVSP